MSEILQLASMEAANRTFSNYRTWLCEELSSRREKNPAYSLNAFSHFLGISPPSLSQIISGKRPLTKKTALRIVEKCKLNAEEARQFLGSALGVGEKQQYKVVKDEKYFQELSLDQFRLIADWYHLAILNLANIKPNQSSPEWIGERLGISVNTAEEAFERLLRLKMLRRRGKGFYRTFANSSIRNKPNAIAMRRHHSQILEKAIQGLAQEKVRMELYSSMTMAIDESKLAEARELIMSFKTELCQLLESGKKERVYSLGLQLFPLSK